MQAAQAKRPKTVGGSFRARRVGWGLSPRPWGVLTAPVI